MAPSILLVEDDDTARVLLSNVLTRAGYHVTEASDGETAIQFLTRAPSGTVPGFPYDVVLTDIRMRGQDGIAVMNVARQQSPPPSVILLTGYGSVETAVAALRANAYDYMLKPCDTGDLLRRVAGAVQQRLIELQRADRQDLLTRCLDHFEHQSPPVPTESSGVSSGSPFQRDTLDRFIQAGSLCLDLFRYTATFDGRPLHVTPIEYALLNSLAEKPGEVLSYEEIVYRTHGSRVTRNEALTLLRAHIHNLRRKLDPDYIVNVRGLGYMLSVPQEHKKKQPPTGEGQ
jgi:DNA-binding response OmpR family regulator